MSTYKIYERPRRMIGEVSSDDPRAAFFMAMQFVSKSYKEAGVVPPMFDCDPQFFAERTAP